MSRSSVTSRPSSSPKKRLRTDDDDDYELGSSPTRLSLESLQRNKSLWYPDGTVVLVCNDTAFRVYQGVLAQRSTVFRDMFRLAPPAIDAEHMDGCLVVRLSDSALDLQYLLHALFSNMK